MPTAVETAAEVLTSWANNLTQEMLAKLDKANDKGFSLAYRSLLRQELTSGGSVEQISNTAVQYQLYLPDYYVFVDLGVKGVEKTYPSSASSPYRFKSKYPNSNMAKSIERWISFTGLRVRENKKESRQRVFDKRKRLSFAIAASVKRKGIAARRFFTDVVNQSAFDKLQAELTAALGTSFTLTIGDV